MSISYVLLILLCIIIILASLAQTSVFKESFDAPLLVYQSEFIKDVVYMDPSVRELFPELSKFHWIRYDSTSSSPFLHMDDVFTFEKKYKNDSTALCILGIEKSLFLTKSKNTLNNETLKDVILGKKTIYAKDTIMQDLLKILVIACDLDPNTIMFEKEASKAYCTVHFDILESQERSNESIDFIDFEKDLDIHKLKMAAPFCYTSGKDTSLYYESMNTNKFPVRTFICFKMMLWMSKDHAINPDYLHKILFAVGDMDDTNYFTKYFDFEDITLGELSRINKIIKHRSQLSILEQYKDAAPPPPSDSRIILQPVQNIYGFYDSENRTLSIYEKMIDGIPLEIVDEIQLRHQVRSEENGFYVVQELSPDEPSKKTVLKQVVPEALINNVKKFIMPEYQCIGDPTIKNKGLCNSVYDAMGRPKKNKTVWDRPCVSNTDCPFYQANKNYPNYRGGCDNGYCEMPLGVKRVGFTLYDGKPMCHGCPLTNPSCCEKQENPDYAFELDFDERKDSLEKPK